MIVTNITVYLQALSMSDICNYLQNIYNNLPNICSHFCSINLTILNKNIMSKKIGVKEVLKMEKEILKKEISALQDGIADYKAQRKIEWKSFKKKTNDGIDTVKKSIDKLSGSKRSNKN
jgi:hypothetical protein